MNDGEFKIDEAVRRKKTKQFSPKQNQKIEEHHLVGKINSSITIPICKDCHDVISSWQNTLSPNQRKNTLVMFLESVAGILELLAQTIRRFAWEVKNGEYVLTKSHETKEETKE